jgi:hypothetical protein
VNYGRKKIYKIYPKAEQISKLNDFQDKFIGCKDKAFNFRNGRFVQRCSFCLLAKVVSLKLNFGAKQLFGVFHFRYRSVLLLSTF